MKYVVTSDYIFDWPVVIRAPDPERAGAIATYNFVGRFRLQLHDEAKDLDAHLAALPPAEREAEQHALIPAVLIGWDNGVVDKKGVPIDFSAAELAEAMRSPFFVGGVYRAYADALAGGARRKN